MLRTRVIPVLLLSGSGLVKTVQYKKPKYIGDPVNTCKIFNELEVDELCFLDIEATKEKREPSFNILQEISNECFMPLSYGGGIDSLAVAEKIFKIGFEKVVINTALFSNFSLVADIARIFGSQAVIASVDVKKNLFGKYHVCSHAGTKMHKKDPVEWIKVLEGWGVGEILLNNIDREGTWSGFDIDLIKKVASSTILPVIAQGGAGSVSDIGKAVKEGTASAVALGSMVVFQAREMGVLINFPDRTILNKTIS
jgi:cyclase